MQQIMADHKVSVAISLLVLGLFGFQHVHCQGRVFRTGSELREFQQFSLRERLDTAFVLPEPATIQITGANQAATVQENVALNIDCLPWLRRFPGGSIQWLSLQLDEFGNVRDPVPTPENPGGLPTDRIRVGGPFNRWLNISDVNLVGGAEDPDFKIFMCQVCVARGTTFQMCHTANYTNLVVGGPPRIIPTVQPCVNGTPTPGEFGGVTVDVTLSCEVSRTPPSPVPIPDVTWFKDGVLVSTGPDRSTLSIDMDFLNQFPSLTMGVFNQDPLGFVAGNTIVLSTSVASNLTSPMLGGFPAGTTVAQARAEVFNTVILGNWECVANNSLGTSSVEYNIRMCGDEPVIPDCAVTTGNSVIFPEDGDILPPGCDICLQAGTTATLDCTVSAGTPPIAYNWTVNGTEVSQNPRLVVREPGNYSCQASNPDNNPVVEASILFFSPRAMITSRIEGRNTDGCDRLQVNDTERMALRNQIDTCIFVDETLIVQCTSNDPTAMLELSGGDGTIYGDGMARINVTESNIDAANTTFSCRITNAQGPCGQFVFQTSVRVYDPAKIDRLIGFGVGNDDHIGAGRPGDVVVPTMQSVTLRCPTSGITEEMTEWRRVVEDSTGCLVEQTITDMTDGFMLMSAVTGGLDDLVLTITNFNASFEGTYVCRTENIAGADADVVSLVTGLGSPGWQTTMFSTCSMMCQDGVRTRSVTCRNSRDQRLLPDFMCDGTSRPVSSLQCDDLFPLPCFLDPIWVPYPWSRCSQDCKGLRTRDVLCQIPRTGAVRPEYECRHLQKPRISEVCEDKCCVADVYPSICNMLGSSHCGTLFVQKLCCWTCGLTVIP